MHNKLRCVCIIYCRRCYHSCCCSREVAASSMPACGGWAWLQTHHHTQALASLVPTCRACLAVQRDGHQHVLPAVCSASIERQQQGALARAGHPIHRRELAPCGRLHLRTHVRGGEGCEGRPAVAKAPRLGLRACMLLAIPPGAMCSAPSCTQWHTSCTPAMHPVAHQHAPGCTS